MLNLKGITLPKDLVERGLKDKNTEIPTKKLNGVSKSLPPVEIFSSDVLDSFISQFFIKKPLCFIRMTLDGKPDFREDDVQSNTPVTNRRTSGTVRKGHTMTPKIQDISFIDYEDLTKVDEPYLSNMSSSDSEKEGFRLKQADRKGQTMTPKIQDVSFTDYEDLTKVDQLSLPSSSDSEKEDFRIKQAVIITDRNRVRNQLMNNIKKAQRDMMKWEEGVVSPETSIRSITSQDTLTTDLDTQSEKVDSYVDDILEPDWFEERLQIDLDHNTVDIASVDSSTEKLVQVLVNEIISIIAQKNEFVEEVAKEIVELEARGISSKDLAEILYEVTGDNPELTLKIVQRLDYKPKNPVEVLEDLLIKAVDEDPENFDYHEYLAHEIQKQEDLQKGTLEISPNYNEQFESYKRQQIKHLIPISVLVEMLELAMVDQPDNEEYLEYLAREISIQKIGQISSSESSTTSLQTSPELQPDVVDLVFKRFDDQYTNAIDEVNNVKVQDAVHRSMLNMWNWYVDNLEYEDIDLVNLSLSDEVLDDQTIDFVDISDEEDETKVQNWKSENEKTKQVMEDVESQFSEWYHTEDDRKFSTSVSSIRPLSSSEESLQHETFPEFEDFPLSD